MYQGSDTHVNIEPPENQILSLLFELSGEAYFQLNGVSLWDTNNLFKIEAVQYGTSTTSLIPKYFFHQLLL